MRRIYASRNASSLSSSSSGSGGGGGGRFVRESTAVDRHQRGRHTAAIVGGAAAGGVFLLVLVFVILLVYRRLKKSSPRTTPASEQSPVRLRRFSYRELKTATGRFSDAHKLGQGGFGSVYKGTLKNGQLVAVKKLDTASLQGEREFMNELSIVGGISSTSSAHIVGLIGFCADSKRKMLVYDFMVNRSLQEALFDEKRRLQLDWGQRVKIVLNVAQALAFLHGKCDPPIVHGDVKPSNVLLDSQFCAKLADFGLARVKTEQRQQDLKSEELQRDSIERERVRSQRLARDRERKRKKKMVASSNAGEDHHVIQVIEGDDREATTTASVEAAAAANPKVSSSIPDLNPAAVESQEETGEEDKGVVKTLSATSGDEQLTDGSGNKSPVLSSPTSKHEELKVGRAATPSSIAGGDDDDDWSKMSQSAYGTEADTWSKISPSEVDCQSEISMDSAGHRTGGQKSGMSFLSRKKSWGRKKATSSPSSGNWWWKQEGGHQGGGDFSIKEYIVDWVSCERGRSRTREFPWKSAGGAPAATAGTDEAGKKKKKARSGSLEWWAECDDGDDAELARRIKAEQKRKRKLQKQQEKLAMSVSRDNSREWWRDQGGAAAASGELFSHSQEFRADNLGKSKSKMKRSMSEESFTFYHSGEIPNNKNSNDNINNNNNNTINNLSLNSNNSMELAPSLSNAGANARRRVRTRSREWWSGEMQRGKEWWSGELKRSDLPPQGRRIFENWSRESLSGELTQRPRHNRHRSRSRSRDWWSGDLLSRATTVSSTPSMRGTVCYVAPEYGGGGGMLTEKADVYSFGVLILVVVSGRRPLQVVASPLSEFERANLISWARHAAQAGRGLDLLDPSLEGVYSKEEASLFISLALLCLQRLPALRPTMSEVVKILSGEAELPALPFEFSPSPPGCSSFKSRRKASSGAVDIKPLLGT